MLALMFPFRRSFGSPLYTTLLLLLAPGVLGAQRASLQNKQDFRTAVMSHTWYVRGFPRRPGGAMDVDQPRS